MACNYFAKKGRLTGPATRVNLQDSEQCYEEHPHFVFDIPALFCPSVTPVAVSEISALNLNI